MEARDAVNSTVSRKSPHSDKFHTNGHIPINELTNMKNKNKIFERLKSFGVLRIICLESLVDCFRGQELAALHLKSAE